MKLFLIATTFFSLIFFSSCINSSTSPTDTELSTDAQIKSLSLVAKDSLTKNLDKFFFSINQNDGLIQNLDSLPDSASVKLFTKLKYKYVKVKMTFASASKVTIEYAPDQVFEYPAVDSIDFSRSPVKVRVMAADGKSSKLYELRLNIHKQNPESLDWKSLAFDGWNNIPFDANKTVAFQGEFLTYLSSSNGFSLYSTSMANGGSTWLPRSQNLPATARIESMTHFANKLYVNTTDQELWSSADGSVWTKISLTNAVSAIYGALVDLLGENHLIVLTQENGRNRLASVSETGALTLCGDVNLPDEFPVSGFAAINKTIGLTEKLTLIAGRDKKGKLLNSVQQMYWDKSGFHCGYNMDNGGNWFPACESPNAYYYDNKMVISCGRDSVIENKSTYISTNYGLSWAKDTTHLFPKSFIVRANSSVVVDAKNFIWIFGGQNKFVDRPHAGINEIWRGRLNRLGFIRQ